MVNSFTCWLMAVAISLIRRRRPVHFYAFDLLVLDGRDLRDRRLLERKRIIRGIIARQPAHLMYVDHIEGRGVELFRFVCESDLEGIVAKRKNSAYLFPHGSYVR
jgi:ATP-dependent DNA ligase